MAELTTEEMLAALLVPLLALVGRGIALLVESDTIWAEVNAASARMRGAVNCILVVVWWEIFEISSEVLLRWVDERTGVRAWKMQLH